MNELELLKTAYRGNPENLVLAKLLSLQLTRTGAWADLLIELAPLADRQSEPWLQLAVGRAALNIGDPRALSWLVPAANSEEISDEERVDALALAILARLANGENVAAEDALNRLLDLAPDHPADDLISAFAARGLTPRRLLKQKSVSNNDLTGLSDFIPLNKTKNRTRFSDIGGMDALKEAARMKIILPFRQPELFRKYGKAAGGGILLYGPPGCGKTHIARAIAGECEAAFYNIGIHDILNLYIGNSERNIQKLFTTARNHRPAILFIDELDALGRKRDLMRHSSLTGTVNAFLAELDGIDSDNENLLVIGATNAPWDIDSAFKRPGRFDQLFFVPPPDEAARRIILDIHFADKPCTGIDTQRIAKDCVHFSGADLAALVDAAASRVLSEILNGAPERPIRMEDILTVKKSARATTGEWIATARNYVEYANQGGEYDAVAEYLKGAGRWIGF